MNCHQEYPQFALVQWPCSHGRHPAIEPPCCITLDALPAAVSRGATVIAREDTLLPFRLVIPQADGDGS